MLYSLLQSVLARRFPYSRRRRIRDRFANGGAGIARFASFFISGVLLAGILLTISAALQPDAGAAVGERTRVSATDGRATPDAQEKVRVESRVEPIVTQIDRNCAAHARDVLMSGLTNYYLQRRLRPGASSDDAAETSSLTGMLAGPADPAVSIPANACTG